MGSLYLKYPVSDRNFRAGRTAFLPIGLRAYFHLGSWAFEVNAQSMWFYFLLSPSTLPQVSSLSSRFTRADFITNCKNGNPFDSFMLPTTRDTPLHDACFHFPFTIYSSYGTKSAKITSPTNSIQITSLNLLRLIKLNFKFDKL